MNTLTDLIDRYIATWNETDAGRRHDLIAQTWTEGARYLDPMLEGEGHDGIDTMIVGVQERFPGHRFRRTGDVESTMIVSVSPGTLRRRKARRW